MKPSDTLTRTLSEGEGPSFVPLSPIGGEGQGEGAPTTQDTRS